MKILRRWLARFVITVGVLSLGLWAGARFLVHTVEDGTVLTTIARTALYTPALQDVIVTQAQSEIDDVLDDEGIDPADYGLEQTLDQAIVGAVGSDDFIDALLGAFAEIEASLTAQLTDDSLPVAPLEFTVDVTDPLHTAISQDPRLAFLVPDTALDPITVPVLGEEEVESIRGGYDWVELADAWGLYLGLGLLAVGFVLLPNKRWIPPKLCLGAGLFVLGLWALARWIDVENVYTWLPGGSEGGVASFMRDLMPQETIDRAQGSLLMLATGLLVASAALFVLIWWLSRGRKDKETAPAPASTGASPPAAPSAAAPAAPPAVAPAGPPTGGTPAPTGGTPVPAVGTRPPAGGKRVPRKARKEASQTETPAPAPAIPMASPTEPVPTVLKPSRRAAAPQAVPPQGASQVKPAATPAVPPVGPPEIAPTAAPEATPEATPVESPEAAPTTAPTTASKVWDLSSSAGEATTPADAPPDTASPAGVTAPPTDAPPMGTPPTPAGTPTPSAEIPQVDGSPTDAAPISPELSPKVNPETFAVALKDSGSTESGETPTVAPDSASSGPESNPASSSGIEAPAASPSVEPPAPPKVKLGRAAARRAREAGERASTAAQAWEATGPTEPPAQPTEPPAQPTEPQIKPEKPEDPEV